MSFPRESIKDLAATISIATEEAIQWLSEDLTIGEDGVAEAFVEIENLINLIGNKLEAAKKK